MGPWVGKESGYLMKDVWARHGRWRYTNQGDMCAQSDDGYVQLDYYSSWIDYLGNARMYLLAINVHLSKPCWYR